MSGVPSRWLSLSLDGPCKAIQCNITIDCAVSTELTGHPIISCSGAGSRHSHPRCTYKAVIPKQQRKRR